MCRFDDEAPGVRRGPGFTGLPVQLATSFAAAVGEELVFRGAIFRIADERLGTAVSGGQSHGLIESVLSGPTLVTGGAFGPEASVIALAVCLAATAVTGLWTVRHGRWRPWRRQPLM